MKNVTYISAGAGSGKTYRLTQQFTALIKEGKMKPEEVILTTFTNKAADEFREKVKAALYAENLFDAAARLDQAMIGTVHSVCDRMVNKYWFELGLAPGMGVMADDETGNEKDFYISQSLADLPNEDELKHLHEFARQFDIQKIENEKPKGLDLNFWKNDLEKVIGLATNYQIHNFALSKHLSTAFYERFVDQSVLLSFTPKELRDMLQELLLSAENYGRGNDKEKRIQAVKDLITKVDHPTFKWCSDVVTVIEKVKKHGDLAEMFRMKAVRTWQSPVVFELIKRYIDTIFTLAARWADRYREFKREKAVIDYNDMEHYMLKLLEIPEVREEIGKEFRYLFVDEFQDSSPIQVKIFDRLSDLMTHSYWVGDYKQSIFGFRGSDVALVKSVVDRITDGENGCSTETLDTSWRSVPEIVDFSNHVFSRTFADILAQKDIVLKKHRQGMAGNALRYFKAGITKELPGNVASYIEMLIHDGAEPKDIAVLAATNEELKKVYENLSLDGIPCSRADMAVVGTRTYELIKSLLLLVKSERDTLARATVAFLTESGRGTSKIIESKIAYDTDDDPKRGYFLKDVPMLRRLEGLRGKLRQKSVSAMTESLIVELNLEASALSLEEKTTVRTVVDTVLNVARTYEDHCVQMNLPASIDGFISFIETLNPAGQGDPEGVQLTTYHKSKGLQWKHVILLSLNDDIAGEQRILKREVMGIHAQRTEEPTADCPYPEVYILLTPYIYGKGNVPETIKDVLINSGDFELNKKRRLEECNRLLYVGVTRAADVLHLALEQSRAPKTLLSRFRAAGFPEIAASFPEGPWDALKTGDLFDDCTLTEEEIQTLNEIHDSLSITDETLKDFGFQKPKKLILPSEGEGQQGPRYISPSGVAGCGEVVFHDDFGERIPFLSRPEDMSEVGNCIHQIFAGIDLPGVGVEQTILNYRLGAVLADPDTIIKAWGNLTGWLEETYGEAEKVYHERPFRLERDGETLVGSIDLVWQTAEGDVLVDFKTAPMGADVLLNPESKHFAGLYAGQLNSYEEALTAAGEKVLARYIYYPVAGLLAQISK